MITATLPPSAVESIKTPWSANSFRHLLATELERWGRVFNDSPGPSWSSHRTHNDELFLKDLANRMRRVAVVLWRDDLYKAARDGAELFINRPFECSLITFDQLWIYENDHSVIVTSGSEFPSWYCVSATMLIREVHGISLAVQIYQPWFPDVPAEVMAQVRAGDISKIAPMVLVSELKDRTVSPHYGQPTIAAGLEFMNLEIVACDPVVISRQVRRASERDGSDIPDLRVITLRKRRTTSGAGDSSDVAWSCQWMVSGHWRNQYFPKTQEHRPVYVMPYIKGPDDKPFRENNAEKIFVVAR